jgi:hypothetical protein
MSWIERAARRGLSWWCCSIALAGLGGSLAGCSDLRVKLPASDSTPPSLVWNVFNYGTREQADYSGSPTINVKRGERYRIILKAHDPQGVRSIELNPGLGSGEISWQCLAPPGGESLAQNKTATLAPQKQDLSVASDGTVLTSIFLITDLDFTMECPAGWKLGSGGAKLTGWASNFYGGTATEVLKFAVAP